MRVEPFTIGDFLHVYNRGNRKMPIVRDEADKWRFLKILRFFNDKCSPHNLFRQLDAIRKNGGSHMFDWPKDWPPHSPIVKILSYCLRENHFHLLLKEIIKGGISLFMKKLGDGLTNYSNIKYDEVGTVFQGGYKGRKPEDDKYLDYLDIYIQVLNPFEEYPGGTEKALKEFDKAFAAAMENPFCSLGETFGRRNLHIIDRDILRTSNDIEAYKAACYEALVVHSSHEIFKDMLID